MFLVRSILSAAPKTDEDPKEIDFFTKQARLQIEARMALAQAKDIAHMQMEVNSICFVEMFIEQKSNKFNLILYFTDGTSKTKGIAHYKYDSKYC